MRTHWHLTPHTAVFLAFVFLATYLLVDYFNIPTVIGIDISRFNVDLLGITINAVIAIVVFALGYYFVEQWNTKRNKNQKDYAFSLLKMSYRDCLQVLNDLYNPQILTEIRKTFHYNNEGDFVTSLKNFPFQNESLISKFAADGILSVEQAKNYHSIKSLFHGLITTYALLSDETNDALRNDYFEEKKRPLTIKIQEQLNALSS